MPWPWTSRPKSPFGFSDHDGTPSASATVTNGHGGTANHHSISTAYSSSQTKTTVHAGRASRPSATASRQTATTAAIATTTTTIPKPPLPRPSAAPASSNHHAKASYETAVNTSRAASSLGFSTSARPKETHVRSSSSGFVPVSATGLRKVTTPSAIPEEAAQGRAQSHAKQNGNHAGAPRLGPIRRTSDRDVNHDSGNTQLPGRVSRNPASIESLSSTSSSLQSDLNNHSHGKQRSISTGLQLNGVNGKLSPQLASGRTFSLTPSFVSETSQAGPSSRPQKAAALQDSRHSSVDEGVYYELPESLQQVNGLNASEIEEMDLKHKAVIDLSTLPAAVATANIVTNVVVSENQTRESMLEAEVARLKKLCDDYSRKPINESSSSIGSSDPITVVEIPAVSANSSEAHRVVRVMKVANEQLQRKIEARDNKLADQLAELEQAQTRHAIELEQQKHMYQAQIKQLVDKSHKELQETTQRNAKRVEAIKRGVAQNAAAADNQQRSLEHIATLQAEIDRLKSLEKTKLDSHTTKLEEAKLKAEGELAMAQKAFAEKEEKWEIETEQMRRQMLEDRTAAECNCGSKVDIVAVEQLKREHEAEVASLKTSIRILEGSRSTTVQQLEEDQRVYRKVSELEASLASKVKALAAERKTSERLRASLTAAEDARAGMLIEKDSAISDKESHLQSMLQDHDGSLQRLRASFEKEKEAMLAEHQATLNARDTFRGSEQKRMEQLLAEAQAKYEALQEQSDIVHEDKMKTAQEQLETTLKHMEARSQQERQALQKALDETRSQLVVQKNALELRMRTQLQEAEHQFNIRQSSEIQSTVDAKSELERVQRELGEEIEKLRGEVTQTKNRDAQVVSELQQQLKDEEENKQQLLDRVARAEAEKDAAEADLAAARSTFSGASGTITEQTETLRRAEGQIRVLNETVLAMQKEVANEKQAALQVVSELRAQMQARERKSNEFHAVKQNEIESLHFKIRTAETKLQIGDVEMESLRETIREKEGTLASLRDDKESGAIWLDEKRALVNKHDQIIDGHLSTIAKLEDTINKMRVRSMEEARAAEVRAAEQQGLVVQWMSASNRKADDAQRLERALKEANNMTESFKLDVRALKNDLKQAEKESKDQKAELKVMLKQLKTAQDDGVSLKNQLESVYRHTRQMSDLEARIQSLSKEMQDSQRTVARRDATIRQLEDALQQNRSTSRAGGSSPTANGAYMATGDSGLQRDLRESRAEVKRLNEKLEMYEQEYRHFFEEYEKLKTEHERSVNYMRRGEISVGTLSG